uniref:Uncharacterized protein n=1 Tax=Rhizophora mucronata TaxID=61149 RepID=A0A2P2L5J0_RHIMU
MGLVCFCIFLFFYLFFFYFLGRRAWIWV